MPKTPSIGIDQNEEQTFIDKYWGRVPKFIHRIPERNICEANPDYLKLVRLVNDGLIPRSNISDGLYREIVKFIDDSCNPCTMSEEDYALLNAYNGLTPCPPYSADEDCDVLVCCNTLYSCAKDPCVPVVPPADMCSQIGILEHPVSGFGIILGYTEGVQDDGNRVYDFKYSISGSSFSLVDGSNNPVEYEDNEQGYIRFNIGSLISMTYNFDSTNSIYILTSKVSNQEDDVLEAYADHGSQIKLCIERSICDEKATVDYVTISQKEYEVSTNHVSGKQITGVCVSYFYADNDSAASFAMADENKYMDKDNVTITIGPQVALEMVFSNSEKKYVGSLLTAEQRSALRKYSDANKKVEIYIK